MILWRRVWDSNPAARERYRFDSAWHRAAAKNLPHRCGRFFAGGFSRHAQSIRKAPHGVLFRSGLNCMRDSNPALRRAGQGGLGACSRNAAKAPAPLPVGSYDSVPSAIRKTPPRVLFLWRRVWDSNPREVSLKRFSRPSRYDRFDNPP